MYLRGIAPTFLLHLCFPFLPMLSVTWPLPPPLEIAPRPQIAVQMRQAFKDATHYYLVFEYVSGGELFDEIVKRTSYTEKVGFA